MRGERAAPDLGHQAVDDAAISRAAASGERVGQQAVIEPRSGLGQRRALHRSGDADHGGDAPCHFGMRGKELQDVDHAFRVADEHEALGTPVDPRPKIASQRLGIGFGARAAAQSQGVEPMAGGGQGEGRLMEGQSLVAIAIIERAGHEQEAQRPRTGRQRERRHRGGRRFVAQTPEQRLAPVVRATFIGETPMDVTEDLTERGAPIDHGRKARQAPLAVLRDPGRTGTGPEQ